METLYNALNGVAKGKKKWGRDDVAKLVSTYEAREESVSQRDFSEKTGIPRSTLLHWLEKKSNIDADLVLVEFLENPVDIAFLHRIITAAHVSFTKNGTASIHNVVDVLDKPGLSPFVASSYLFVSTQSVRADR